MRPDGGVDRQRIVCPQCQSNNFVGQPHCWQCRAALPSPLGGSASSRSGVPSGAGAAISRPGASTTRSTSSWRGLLLALCVGVLTFLIVLFVAFRADRQVVTSSAVVAPSATPMPNTAVRRSSAPPGSGDPLNEEARQVIEREVSQHGDPPLAPDGRVHLSNGSSISLQEWKDAKDRLQSSAIAH